MTAHRRAIRDRRSLDSARPGVPGRWWPRVVLPGVPGRRSLDAALPGVPGRRWWPRVVLLVVAAVVAGCSGASGGGASGGGSAAAGGGGADGRSGSAATHEPGPYELVDATAELGLDEALAGIRGHAVAVADVDGDGWDDLFVGTFADREPDTYRVGGADGPAPDRLLRGSADGFRIDGGFEGRLGRTAGAAFADLDGDGDPDLVVSRNVRDAPRSDAPSEIYRNDDGSLVPATVLDAVDGGRAVAILDLDGDGLPEVVLAEDRWSGGSTTVFHNDGDLTFSPVGAPLGLPDGVAGLGAAAGDLDGDGRDDLVIGGSNRWFRAVDGGLVEAEGSPLPWEPHGDEDDPDHVTLFDADGDGRLDVLIGQHFNSTLDDGRPEPFRLWLNRDGAGRAPDLVEATDDAGIPALATKSPRVLAVDLDADGVAELVTTAAVGPEQGPFEPFVLAGAVGEGGVRYEAPDTAPGPHYWIDAVSLDADGDGRPDLFFLEWEPAIGSRLFLNRPA